MDTPDTPPPNDEQLRSLLDTMRLAIEQNSSPQFKIFWDAREKCISLFKEGIHPAVRSLLWQQLRDLSKEARTLSDFLGEQAAYAAEQISMALEALEGEIESVATLRETLDPLVISCRSLGVEGKALDGLQREAILYNRWTDRILGLRKELIATDMRIKEKNALFKRLSAVGDEAFPRRKELIEEISDRFLQAVNRFAQTSFSDEGPTAPFFVIKNEIKELQAYAKMLTLSSKAFKEARVILSGCWDKVRASEKQKKELIREKQVADQEVAQALIERVKGLEGDRGVVERGLQELEKELRGANLEGREFKSVIAQVAAVRGELAAEVKKKEAAAAEASRLLADGLTENIETLVNEGQKLNGDELAKRREALAGKIGLAELVSADRRRLEGQLSRVADLIVDAEETAFLNTPEDHPEALSRLEMVLERKSRRRSGIKQRLEELRREAGGSSLDFEAGLRIDGLMREEKGKLILLDGVIGEIQTRLSTLQKS